MRWTVELSGEHGEGLEGRERFEAIVGEFAEKLGVNGWTVGHCHQTLCAPPPAEAWNVDEIFADPDSEAETAVEASGEGEVEDEAVEVPTTLTAIRARIREEKAKVGGNRILSQAELSEAIGVSRYKIRKALGK